MLSSSPCPTSDKNSLSSPNKVHLTLGYSQPPLLIFSRPCCSGRHNAAEKRPYQAKHGDEDDDTLREGRSSLSRTATDAINDVQQATLLNIGTIRSGTSGIARGSRCEARVVLEVSNKGLEAGGGCEGRGTRSERAAFPAPLHAFRCDQDSLGSS